MAENTRLDSGRLEPWKGNASTSVTPVASYSVSAATKTLFRYNSSTWVGSNDELDIVRSPIAEDPWERIYLTGMGGSSGYPRMTLATIIGSGTYYRLGLPSPPSLPSAPSLTTSSVTDAEVPQSRSYIYTYVSAYGEEGPPSAPQISNIVDVYSDQIATVTFGANVSYNNNITKKRLYRTDASGTYRRVAEVPYGQTTYADSKDDIGASVMVSPTFTSFAVLIPVIK